ncbi:S8 family serine peptidase [Kineosporia sp. R_H_3]|uniref:S8 family serine peptidase n=1 Tax=Kineosporia sp. R_H_3 TaxID=1961848 RepID=UPI00350F025A
MAARPEVAAATRAHLFAPLVTPTDTDYATQQKTYLTSIAAPTGWDYGRGNASVKIAVVDTGVDVGHPDLVGKVVDQYDTVTDTTDVTDGVGHGTFVAGVAAAATNNAKGIAGVGFNSSIVAVKVADGDGFMSDIDVAEGIRKAADLGAKVINISLGSDTSDTATSSAVAYAQGKGALVVASAGNSGQEGNPKMYPAAYAGVLSVGATDAKGHRAWFSEHGTWVSMAAPGINIRGTTPRALDPALTIWSKPNYDNGNGTSFSAPMVAGAAALLAARAPGATAAQIKAALVSTAHGYTPSYGLGKGQLDVAKAMAAIVPTSSPTVVGLDGTTLVDGTTNLQGTVGTPKALLHWFVDGTLVGTGSPVVWDYAGLPNGSHTVVAKDCTAAGVCPSSGRTSTVTIDIPAVAAVVTPASGTASGSFTVGADFGALPASGAAFVDGVRVGRIGSSNFRTWFEVNASQLSDGSHTVQVGLCDPLGVRCDGVKSAPVTVVTASLHPTHGTVVNPQISPNGDGVKDTLTLPYTLDRTQTVVFKAVNSGGTTVRTVSLGSKPAGSYTFVYDGRNDAGTFSATSSYTLRLETTDGAGLKGLVTVPARIDKVVPTVLVTSAKKRTFYPVADTYKDTWVATYDVNDNATGTAKTTLTVKSSTGTKVRTLTASNSLVSGAVTEGRLTWDGKNTAGALVAAGTYSVSLVVTDTSGQKSVAATDTVTVSRKKLTTFTKVVSKSGFSAYAIGNGAACVTSTRTGSTYASGLWLKNNCPRTNPQIAAAWYHLTVPGAVSYTSFKVTTSGRSHSQPAEVIAGIYGTQIDEYDLTYPSKKVTVATTQTLTLGTITGPGHAPGKVVDLVVFVPNDAYGPLTDWDVQTAKVTVTYRALA